MRWEDAVSCLPMVQMGTGRDMQPAYLLAWVWQETTQEWRAVVTYPRVSGDPPAIQRIVTNVRSGFIQPVEPPAAYADVPRLQFGADGTMGPWERQPPSDS